MTSPVDPDTILDVIARAMTGDEEQARTELADIIATIPDNHLPGMLGAIGLVLAAVTVTSIPTMTAIGLLNSAATLKGRTTDATRLARHILLCAATQRTKDVYPAIKQAGPRTAGQALTQLLTLAAYAARATPTTN